MNRKKLPDLKWLLIAICTRNCYELIVSKDCSHCEKIVHGGVGPKMILKTILLSPGSEDGI